MNNIIKSLKHKNWPQIYQQVTRNQIEWDYLIDQINTTLHFLAYHNKLDILRVINPKILNQIIDMPNLEGDTIAHIAGKMNYFSILMWAISIQPELIYRRNNLKTTPLYYVLNDPNTIEKIAEKIQLVDHYVNSEYSLVDYYVITKNLTMLSKLLSIIRSNKITEQAMFTAMGSLDNATDKQSILKIFWDNGFSINTLNENYLSLLNIAITQQDYVMTKFLLEHDINVNYAGPENNHHSLTIAIKNNDISIIRLLIRYQIKVDIPDKNLQTAVHHLFSEKRDIPLSLKQKILSMAPNINATDNRMNSVLHLLLQHDDWTKYQDILAKSKLKIYLRNKDGLAPIDQVTNQTEFFNLVYQSYINQLNPNTKWVDNLDNSIAQTLDHREFYSKIMTKIKNGQSYPVRKKPGPMLTIINPPDTNITHFTSYTYNYILYLYYVLQKYPTVKIPVLSPQYSKNKLNDFYRTLTSNYRSKNRYHKIIRSVIRDYVNHCLSLVNHIIIWVNTDLYFMSPFLVESIKETRDKYTNVRFILLKVTILTENYSNHANILIFDLEYHHLERFDPYGQVPYDYNQSLDDFLEKFWTKNFPGTTYYSPNKMSSGISVQVLSDEKNKLNYIESDPKGFCVAWCVWYVELRLKNTEIKPKSLIKRTILQINQREDKFKDYIRKYSNYLDQQKNQIMKQINFPKKYWYARNIPWHTYRSYLRSIRKIYADL